MDTLLEVKGLRKRFGRTQALDGMTFTAHPGRITGFVGPNGAGKSTTLRTLLGLDRPDAGEALVDGRRYRDLRRPLAHLGALLDASALHPGRSARDHLLWQARSQGLGARRVDEVLHVVGLGDVGRRKAGGYSLGMRQRLGIASALVADPPALVLDEPFNGLDPEGFVWIRAFLAAMAAEGRTVLVSSHLMAELQDTADHLVVVGRGRVLVDSGVRELLESASRDRVAVRTTSRPEATTALARAGGTVATTGPDTLVVSGLRSDQVVSVLTADGLGFSEVSRHRASLEEAYMELTRDAVQYRGDGPR